MSDRSKNFWQVLGGIVFLFGLPLTLLGFLYAAFKIVGGKTLLVFLLLIAAAVYIFGALWSMHSGITGGGRGPLIVVKRHERPILFWFTVLSYTCLGIGCLAFIVMKVIIPFFLS